MKQLEPVDDKVRPEIEDILEKLNKGEEIHFAEPASSQKTFIRYNTVMYTPCKSLAFWGMMFST